MVASKCVALVVVIAGGCSFAPREPGPIDDDTTPDASMSSAIEWIGDLELRRDGFAIPLDKVLPGTIELCAQTFPIEAAVSATVRLGDVDIAMTVDADHTGSFGNNRRWCAVIPASAVVADRELAAQVIARDAAGASTRADLAVTPRAQVTLFDVAADANSWRMAGDGTFAVEADLVRARPAGGLGLYWCAIPTPADFELELDAMLDRFDDNSGIFIRFRDPDGFGYENTAWVGVHDGLEIQIDEIARPDGADVHRTGAVYEQRSSFSRAPDGVAGAWRHFTITVRGSRVTVRIDGAQVTDLAFAGDVVHPDRGKPTAPGAPRFVGLQSHTGAVAFRHVLLRAL